MAGKVNSAGGFSEYDEVPMVDKAVDAEWKKQLSLKNPYDLRGSSNSNCTFIKFSFPM